MATMEKPKPKAEVPALAVAPKKKSAEEAVRELEERLAALGGPSPAATEDDEEDLLNFSNPAPTPVQAPVAPPPDEKEAKSGKNALLARIMAAQEKAKEAAPPPIDLLGPPPSFDTLAPPQMPPPQMAPPPVYQFAPPPLEETPPPAFDMIEDAFSMQPPPPHYSSAPAVMPSAPAFEDYEDLLGGAMAPMAPPMQEFVPAPPPTEEEFIMGMEGLSQEERKALMEEQRKIMEQIEKEKLSNASAIASAQADNFDMRSTSNAVNAIGGGSRTATGNRVNLGGGREVALHGPERTKEAIKDGTAILVQCVNCENWMQVTGNATLMYCPVCAVVSPIDQSTAAMTKEEAMQMEADRKLAESLQNEEYEQADTQTRSRAPSGRPATRSGPTLAPAGESWWDTVSNMFTGETSRENPVSPAERQRDERASLVSGGGGGRPAARVAQSAPLFSCVVDSVNSTVGTLTGTNLSQDREGNVHGVDASSLLAVSNVGRNTEYSRMDQD